MTDALQYLLDYYKARKPWDINMVHGVNDKNIFESYLNNHSVHMFEVDIEDKDSDIKDIILKHEGIGDVSFVWAIEQLVQHKKSLKLDIKIPKGEFYRQEFHKYVFDLLCEHWDPQVPLWIHADILNGPNWENSNFEYSDTVHFIQLYNAYHQDNLNTMLSLGYLTSYTEGTPVQSYTTRMLEEMRSIVESVNGLVTVSLRYTGLMEKPDLVHEFLKLGSVTIWNREDRISHDDFIKLANYTAELKVFKDLTGKDKNPIWN